MRNLIVAGAAILLGLPGPARASDSPAPPSILFPGSLSISAANGEPTEPGNVTSSTTLEQGITIGRHGSVFVVGFVNLSYRADSDGYAWNNATPYRSGLKLVHVDSQGVFEASIGVMGEDRGKFAATHPTGSLSYWRGWRGDSLAGASSRLRPAAFPGSTYVASGYLTNREARNWITAASIEQGATVYSRARFAVIPYLRITAGADTEGRPWNNRSRLDTGLQISRSVSGGVIQAGVARRRSYDRASRQLTPSTVAFVNLWMGWSPRLITQ